MFRCPVTADFRRFRESRPVGVVPSYTLWKSNLSGVTRSSFLPPILSPLTSFLAIAAAFATKQPCYVGPGSVANSKILFFKFANFNEFLTDIIFLELCFSV